MAVITISDRPKVTLSLGSPAILHWEDETGYVELEVGPLSVHDQVIQELDGFWAGKWRDWSYGHNNEQYVVAIEMERINGRVMLRVDYHHMQTHLGVDRSATIARELAEPGVAPA